MTPAIRRPTDRRHNEIETPFRRRFDDDSRPNPRVAVPVWIVGAVLGVLAWAVLGHLAGFW